MKEGIHPKYEPTEVRCACGEVIKTSSTKQDLRVDICSKCHPFFTGKQKLVDTGGRVDRFKKRFKRTRNNHPMRDMSCLFGGSFFYLKNASCVALSKHC